ncbi:MAG: hypothetical protein UFS73_00765 [Weissella confusa]|nr:hypothetical protein [Weissella confusa]
MAEYIKAYDANSVTLTVDGTVIQGFQNGDMVTYNNKEDMILTEVDAQGFPSFAINNSRLGQITINLSGNSASHKYLNSLANSHKQFPVVILSDTEKISATHAFIAKPADGAYGKQTPKRTYTIETLDMAIEVR